MVASKLYSGHVMHQRIGAVGHYFEYPVHFAAFDVDELETLSQSSRLFGYNSRALYSVRDQDYLPQAQGSLRARVEATLDQAGIPAKPTRIVMVSSPRFLGMVFNPVSFFYCYGGESLVALIAQVNNTFGETHLYVMPAESVEHEHFAKVFRAQKSFHVSPFFDLEGEYEFLVSHPLESIDIRINKNNAQRATIKTRLFGEGVAFNDQALIRSAFRAPFRWWSTFPRIVYQAVKLRYLRRLPVYSKPVPTSEWTVGRRKPTLLQRFARRIVERVLNHLERGSLTMVYPDSTSQTFVGKGPGTDAHIVVHDYRFFTRVAFGGDVAFGESYTAGEWESDDLTSLIRLFAENWNVTLSKTGRGKWFVLFMNRMIHRLRDNTVGRSRRNIAAHYDLSNELYALFLDPSMTYSCGIHERPDDSLEVSLERKLRSIIEKTGICESDHVLEIGSGWGSFAILAAKTTGCRVTSITLSEEQLKYARERAAAEGLSDRVKFELRDYRHVVGSFDKIVSIEMLEAVGERHIKTFFSVCDRVLKPNGVVTLQVITMPEDRHPIYRASCDWIQKHIFPGAFLPSVTSLVSTITNHSQFVVEDLENIGVNYAHTLRLWRERFMENIEQVKKLGFDSRFIRAWQYYLSYCEAGFVTRSIGDVQLVLTRPGNTALPTVGRLPGHTL